MSNMTGDRKKIKEMTGLGVGELYWKEVGEETKISIYQYAIYDEDRGNFHLYPKVEDLHKLDGFKNNRDKLRELIIAELINRGAVDLYAKEFDKKSEKNDKLYVSSRSGKKGTLRPLDSVPDYKKNNWFFSFIPCKMNGVKFYLNFMRFFVSKDSNVNCIYGPIQYDMQKGNSKKLNYPTSYRNQHKYSNATESESLFYNPPFSVYERNWRDDSKEIAERVTNLTDDFLNFIDFFTTF